MALPCRRSATPLLVLTVLGVFGSTWHLAEGKMVMGIAKGQDYELVSTFCFTFPRSLPSEPVPTAHIHSQSIVSSNGHKFLVLNYSDVQQGLPCADLVKRAKVIEPLNERTKEVIAYDLTLNVEPSMAGQQVAAVIARCGEAVNAEYIVEFTNPGGFLERHWACSELGLQQSYLWLSVAVALAAPVFVSAQRVLQRRQVHNDLSAMFFASAAFFSARIWLFTVHLLVYSNNGMGLGMLHFVAQFLDFLSTTMATLVLLALAHGVYITRPCIPPGSDERKVLMQIICVFASTFLLATLASGFKVEALLAPFGTGRSGASMPYLVTRCCAGIYCCNKGFSHAVGEEAMHKKHYVIKFGMIAASWLLTMPFLLLVGGEDAIMGSASLIDMGTLSMFGTVLYEFWPSRFGALFNCIKPTERMHPYAEFGLDS